MGRTYVIEIKYSNDAQALPLVITLIKERWDDDDINVQSLIFDTDINFEKI